MRHDCRLYNLHQYVRVLNLLQRISPEDEKNGSTSGSQVRCVLCASTLMFIAISSAAPPQPTPRHTLQYTVPTRSHLRQRALRCRLGKTLCRRPGCPLSDEGRGGPAGLSAGLFPAEQNSREMYGFVLLARNAEEWVGGGGGSGRMVRSWLELGVGSGLVAPNHRTSTCIYSRGSK